MPINASSTPSSELPPQLVQSTLEALIDASSQGFFVFGPSFIVEPPSSKVCIDLLGLDPVGKPVDLVLWATESSQRDFLDGVKLVFTGQTPADVVFDLLESETRVGERLLKLTYRLLSTNQILILLTDESQQRTIENLTESEDQRRGLLLKAVSHRAAFGSFVREFSDLFTTLSESASALSQTQRLKELTLEIHTIKGNAGFFEFTKTAAEAHRFEQHLADNQSLGGSPQFKPYTLALKKAYYEELSTISSFLGERWLREIDAVSVPQDVYLKLEAWMRKTHPEDKTMNALLQRYRTVPFRDMLSRFPDMAQSLAKQLGKQLHPVTVEGGDFPVLPDPFESLISTLVHLVRNMVDHGIEPPEDRVAAGKSAAGLLQIRISREADALFMVFSDDGRGVNFAGVEAKARDLGVLPPGKIPTSEALLDLIFLSGFSTAGQITDISGRGVGLSAVKDVVTRLGGTIHVNTRAGRGTSFDIMLPVQGDRS